MSEVSGFVSERLFAGGGEVGDRLRSFNWSQTPLGAVETWSPSLKTALSILLPAHLPMFLAWGDDRILFYNDAYRLLQTRDRSLPLGQPLQTSWSEDWSDIQADVDHVSATGQSMQREQCWLSDRDSSLAEHCLTWSYSAIWTEADQIGGVLATGYKAASVATPTCKVELQQAEATIREREARLRLALKAAKMGTWEIDLHTGAMQFDQTLDQLFGWLPEASPANQNEWYQWLHPDDRAPVKRLFQQAVAGEAEYDVEYRAVRSDGSLRWVISRGDIIRDAAGQPTRAIGVAADITDRKAAAEALRQSEERFQAFMNYSPAAAWITDREGQMLYLSQTYFRMFQLSTQDPIGKTIFDVYPVDIAQQFLSNIQQAAETHEVVETIEVAPRPDGTIGDFLVYKFPIVNGSGAVLVGGVAVDITDRMQAQAALRESEARFRSFAQNSNDVVWITDAHTYRLIYVSPSYEQVWGRSANELYADLTRFIESVHPDDRAHVQTGWQRCTQGKFDQEYRVLRPDGSLVWIHDRGFPIYDDRGELLYLGGIAEDITDRKQTEEARWESETLFRTLANHSPVGIFMSDVEGNCQYVNDRWCAIAGMLPEAAQGKGWISAIHPEDRSRIAEAWYEAAQRGQVFTAEYRFQTPQGETTWVQGNATALQRGTSETVGYLGTLTDITKRKQTEEVLRESEARFRQMTDSAPMLVWMSGIDKLCHYFNQSWLNFTGRTLEQELGNGWTEGVHPDDFQRCLDTYTAAFDAQRPFEMDYRLRHANGEYRWIIDVGTPRFTPEGTFLGFIGSCFDIHDRKQAEAALRQSEERYRMLFESIDEGFCVIQLLFDQNGTPINYRFLEVNPAFEQQTGLQQAAGKTIRQLVPNLENHWIETYGKIALTGESRRFESGSKVMNRWFDVYAFRIGQPEERKVALLFTDISDRKRIEAEREQAETALRQSEEQSRNILESITDAFFALDENWQFTYVNQTAGVLVDRTPSELIGKNFWEEFPGLHDTEFEQMHRRVMHDRVSESLTEFYPDHDRWYEVRSYPAAHGITVYFRNVTDQKRIEAEREQLLHREQAARETAETANRVKDEFLAVLSHELRSPLNPILGWSRLLQSSKLDEAKTTQALKTIERNAKLLSELIEDLLDVSRILQGKLNLNISLVDLALTIQGAIETVRLAAEAKSIAIDVRFTAQGVQVLGDSTRLQQVVWNLLSNAVKFTPAGGSVAVRLEQHGTEAQITVSDTGKGIHPDFLPHVFDYFQQEDGRTTRRFGGLGLGLAIVRHLVELHGGTVWAESQGEELGATFTVRLPLMPTPIVNRLDPAFTERPLDLAGIQALVVDDEPDSRELIAFVLEQAGAGVVTASSAGEALTVLTRSQLDVLLSDIGMPEMDGYMLMQQVRTLPAEQGGHVPAIALTAYAGDFNQQQALSAGFQRHLAKPVEPRELIRAIADLIKRTK